MDTRVSGRVAGWLATVGCGVASLSGVSCSQSDLDGADGFSIRAPAALSPRGGQVAPPTGRAAVTPIRVPRGGEAVWGEAPVTIIDTRQIQPQIQVREPWTGRVRDVESVLEDRGGEDHERAEQKLRERRREGEPNTLPIGGLTAEPRGHPGPFFPGIQQTPWQPPDCTIAVGKDYIVETVNMVVAWYTRTGSLVFSQNLDSTGSPGFFEPLGGGTFCFDPKCFYDHIDNRYVIVALETYGSTEAWIDIAVSDDEDPNGVWYKYRTNAVVTDTSGGATYWVDYPGFGYDKNAYYVNGNLFGLNGVSGWGGVLFRVFKKPPVLGGQPAVFADLRPPSDEPSGSVQAAHHFGNNQAAFFVSTDTTTKMRIHAIKNAATTPSLVTTLVTVPGFGYSSGDAPTPDGGSLSVIDDRIFNVVWRDGDMYFGHNSFGFGKNIARWYHVKTNNWPASGAVTSVEAGNINPGTDVHSFFPALMVDKCKNVGLVVGTCSSTQNPDIRVTGRLAGDPAGTMGPLTVTYPGPGTTNGRWGDYFAMCLDPVDLVTFWYVGEYKGPGGWGTYIGSFKVGCAADYNCDGFVNGVDFDTFVEDFELGSSVADYNGDGFVNGVDFDTFTFDFIAGC